MIGKLTPYNFTIFEGVEWWIEIGNKKGINIADPIFCVLSVKRKPNRTTGSALEAMYRLLLWTCDVHQEL